MTGVGAALSKGAMTKVTAKPSTAEPSIRKTRGCLSSLHRAYTAQPSEYRVSRAYQATPAYRGTYSGYFSRSNITRSRDYKHRRTWYKSR